MRDARWDEHKASSSEGGRETTDSNRSHVAALLLCYELIVVFNLLALRFNEPQHSITQ